MPGVYYNEHDPKAAAWLRELIKQKHLPAGDVDERSIEDVVPSELRGFTQCHFFAGIGGWPLALRQAGWCDDRPVWTGSPPCQPFSAAGERSGTADERHLWPHFFHIIQQVRPAVIFGEQVDAAIRFGWLDLVFNDLQGEGYACGARLSPACSVGAPHIRQRINFVAYAEGVGRSGRTHDENGGRGQLSFGFAGEIERVADADGYNGSEKREGDDAFSEQRQAVRGWEQFAAGAGAVRGVRGGDHRAGSAGGGHHKGLAGVERPRQTNGFWGDADWLHCRDGKWRPVEPGTQPLAHGVPARVGRLRGYGNAIVVPQSKAFIEDVMEWLQ